MAKGDKARDAGSGRYMPLKEAQERPKTTVVENPQKCNGKKHK